MAGPWRGRLLRRTGRHRRLPAAARQDRHADRRPPGGQAAAPETTCARLPFAVLESIRVDPGARGTGVGTRLVEHFLAWARAKGAKRASVTAYAANDGAQRFYRRHGFAPMSVMLRREL